MDFEKLITEISKILDTLKIIYAITGGYAVSIWGRPRSTFDIDVIIELSHSKLAVFSKALKAISEMSYIDEQMAERAVERKGEFNFIHIESGIKVDFWVQDSGEFSKLKLARRVPKNISGRKIYFVSPEDLILSKLLWHKESGSELQLRDVESVLKFQTKLDAEYLKKWTKKQTTQKILKTLWKRNKKV